MAHLDVFPASLKHDTWRRQSQIDEDTALPGDTGLGTGEVPYDYHYVEEATDAQELENAQREDETDDNNSNDSQQDQTDTPDSDSDSDESSSNHRDPHAYVGISLITGFILMYLIDTLPKQYLTKPAPQRFQISLNNLNFNATNRTDSVGSLEEHLPDPTTPTAQNQQTSSSPSSTTTGLVIHACADGIALGASSTTTSRLTFIIFLALIVHKAPAAFGLTSVLLKQGLPKRSARAHLIVFALAAPLGALLTWFAAHLLGYSSATGGESMSTEFATGILLLFSGGTFLYVAVHTMHDSASHSLGGEGGAQMNGYRGVPMSDLYEAGEAAARAAHGPKGPAAGGGKVGDTMITVLGMLLPLLLNFGHGH